uniref:C-type lectin domain-containing protein n=1 Tax=Sinocyclocheilus grahami TaxID=75366 RepID=A0A672N300_SINGR
QIYILKDIKTSNKTPESDSVKIRSSRAAAVCLGLLCVLLLTAVIVLCVHIHTKSTNYTEERQQLLTKITNLTEERDQLLTSNANLFQLSVHWMFTDGWIYYQFSLYYVSTETKSWTESRRYCIERGADLVIIKDSQKQKISCGSQTWIGLTDIEMEGTWKWVDGNLLPRWKKKDIQEGLKHPRNNWPFYLYSSLNIFMKLSKVSLILLPNAMLANMLQILLIV